eukprot:4409258-Prymnesium_polylepis.1
MDTTVSFRICKPLFASCMHFARGRLPEHRPGVRTDRDGTRGSDPIGDRHDTTDDTHTAAALGCCVS